MSKKDNTRSSFKSAFTSGLQEDIKKVTLSNRLVASEAERVVIGIPIPALLPQILQGSDVDPLGRMNLFVGDSGAGKSALAWEKGRWYLQSGTGAGACYILNEPRDSPDYRRSIFTDQYIDEVVVKRTHYLEEWQDLLTNAVMHMETLFKNREGCAWPGLFILDSTTGTLCKKVTEDIIKEGHAKVGFAVEANLIDRYMHVFPGLIQYWPLTLYCTNHIKWGANPINPNFKEMRITGGNSLRFYSTYIYHVIRHKDISRGNVGGYRMEIKTLKMFGQGNRRIEVEVLWWNEPQKDGKPKQVTVFDWHGGIIDYISALPSVKFKEVEDIIDFPIVNANVRTCNCPKLGIKKPVPYSQVGEAIMHDNKILTQLQDYFSIHRRSRFAPGVPYNEQIAEAIRRGSIDNQASVTQHFKEDDGGDAVVTFDQTTGEVVDG